MAINSQAPETGGNSRSTGDLVRDLSATLAGISHSGGWAEIQSTAYADSTSPLAGLRRGLHLVKAVKPAAVEQSLAALTPAERETREIVIRNSVAFAKNVLEAETSAHERSATLGWYRADMTASGPHMTVKALAADAEAKQRQTNALVSQVLEGRKGLPITGPEGVSVSPDGATVFYGFAELYGMARAGYDPTDLVTYMTTAGVQGVNVRTQTFLREHAQIGNYLIYDQNPVELLGRIGVDVPAAIEIADRPTEATIMAVAQRLAQTPTL